ncbi:hypothetical protein TNCV_4212301 [Trichonephila clavipes]|nr:hypothetical protein TNCV_4212301 [Trichonephila clavipes]
MFTRAVGSLVVRASDSRPDGLGSMPVPPNTFRVMEYALVKSMGPKSCGLNHECRGLENISLPFSSIPTLWRLVSPVVVLMELKWPVLAICGKLLPSNGPIVDSRDQNLVLGYTEATHDK